MPSDAARDASIDAPAGPAPAVPGGWHLIDSHSVIDCVVSPCGHISDVPAALQTDWARARVEVFDVISAARQAGDAVALERGLKCQPISCTAGGGDLLEDLHACTCPVLT